MAIHFNHTILKAQDSKASRYSWPRYWVYQRQSIGDHFKW
jgi:hypothetical protein